MQWTVSTQSRLVVGPRDLNAKGLPRTPHRKSDNKIGYWSAHESSRPSGCGQMWLQSFVPPHTSEIVDGRRLHGVERRRRVLRLQ